MTVTAARECQWAAAAQADWIAIVPPSSGQGEGAVQYAVQANPAPAARRGAIVVEGQAVEVSQAAAPCSFELDRRTLELPAEGGTGAIAIRTHALCAWTAASAAAWLTVTDRQGTGPFGVRYAAAANTGPARRARLTVAGRTVEVTQAAAGTPDPGPAPPTDPPPGPPPNPDPPPNPGPPPAPDPPSPDPAPRCEYEIAPDGRSTPADGGTGSVEVRTTDGCTWTASSEVSWIAIVSGASGTGRGEVRYRVDPNESATERRGTLRIAGRTFSVEQRAAAPRDVTVSGEARNVRGSCPSLTFDVGDTTVATNGDTTFDRGNCRHVANGTSVTVTGVRQPDRSVLASRVEIQRGGS